MNDTVRFIFLAYLVGYSLGEIAEKMCIRDSDTLVQECEGMLREIQVEHISVMRCEDKLFSVFQMVQHNCKNALFNICLDIGKVFVTIVERCRPGENGSKENRNVNSLCGAAGKDLFIQEFPLLNDDFGSLAANDIGVSQVLGFGHIGQGRIKRPNHSLQSTQQCCLLYTSRCV